MIMAGVLTDTYFDQKQQLIDLHIHHLDDLLEEAYADLEKISPIKAGDFLVNLRDLESEKRDLEIRFEQSSDTCDRTRINGLLEQVEVWLKLNAARIMRMEKTVN